MGLSTDHCKFKPAHFTQRPTQGPSATFLSARGIDELESFLGRKNMVDFDDASNLEKMREKKEAKKGAWKMKYLFRDDGL